MIRVEIAAYVNFLHPKGVKAFVKETGSITGDRYHEVGPVSHNGTVYHTRIATDFRLSNRPQA